jgi:serine/threonine protein kinase
MIGEAEYLTAISKKSPFFVVNPDADKNSNDRWEAESIIPPTWIITRRNPWTYVGPVAERMLVNGWKIHLSATLKNAEEILFAAIEVCCAHGITFKYLRSTHELLKANAESAPRSGSGKFVTIYPDSNEQVDNVVNELYPALKRQSGPYILSDIRYRDSPIFFRHGGFVSIERSDEKGNEVSLVPGTDGLLREDVRQPNFIPTEEGVKKPESVKVALEAYMREDPTPLDEYKLSPLHFSNAGGVYRGQKSDNQVCLLKEARPFAGIDGCKRDAVERLAVEWEMLNTLAETGFTPKPIKKFTAWEHQYIEMEYFEGMTLNHWLSINYPYQSKDKDSELLENFKQKILNIGRQILKEVEDVHRTGYVHGDIHLGNFMIDDSGQTVRMIDFEDGRSLDSTNPSPHNALGFQAPLDYTAQEADWFAVSRTLSMLCFTQTSISMLSPEHWTATLNDIAEVFGTEYLELIREAERRCPNHKGVAIVPFTPALHPLTAVPHFSKNNMSSQIDSFKKDLVEGINATRHAVPNKLFPGDVPHGNQMSSINIKSGAAGVLLSLSRSGSEIDISDLLWLERITRSYLDSRKLDLGLFSGLAGVGMTAYETGRLEFAAELLDIVKNHWQETKKSDLESGLAGQALALVSYGSLTNDEIYLEEGRRIGYVLKQRLMKNEAPWAAQVLTDKAGLFHGWSGVALLWLVLSKIDILHSAEYLDYAIACIKKDLLKTVIDDTGVRGVADQYNRSLPYLADGSAGILIAVCAARIVSDDNSLFSDEWDSLLNACCSSQYAFSGLCNGRAGIIIADQFASNWSRDVTDSRDRLLSSLDSYALTLAGTLQFPGDSYLRLSADYSTGSAGILTALNVISHNPWDFFPVLGSKDLFCGKAADSIKIERR